MKKIIYGIITILVIISLHGCGSAFQSLKKEADKGNAVSQNEVGLDYYYGTKDIKIDKKLGLEYLEKSAKQNNSIALFNIALINQKNKNYKKAIQYYNRAIKNNYGPAYGNLAIIYQKGNGVEKNLDKSIELYTLAHKNGDYLAKRNIAILYKKLKKYTESEEAFKDTLFAPTYKKNSYGFKQFVCLELMNMNNEQNNFLKAYEWGATAILAGIFDGKINNEEKHLETFITIRSKLSESEKNSLSKNILLNHYKIFEVYEYYFKKYPEIKSNDAVINLSSNGSIHLLWYQMSMNSDTIKTINYFKTKSGTDAKINVAIGNIKLSSSYIKLGAIVPQYGLAIDKINEAKKTLDSVNSENLIHQKNNINAKLAILENVYNYQTKVYDLKRTSDKIKN